MSAWLVRNVRLAKGEGKTSFSKYSTESPAAHLAWEYRELAVLGLE